MVIHDMRNPTNSIQYALKKFKDNLHNINKILNSHATFNEKCQNLFFNMCERMHDRDSNTLKLQILADQLSNFEDYIKANFESYMEEKFVP